MLKETFEVFLEHVDVGTCRLCQVFNFYDIFHFLSVWSPSDIDHVSYCVEP